MSGEGQRGQTVLDFAVGVSVFLIVVAFVLTFVPGMVQPFQESTQQETAASDRLADQLAADLLAENVSTPYVLDRGCVAAFFALENSDGDDANDADVYTDNDGEVRSTLFDIKDSNLYGAGDCTFDTSNGVFERLAVGGSDFDVRVSLTADVDDDGDPGLLCLDAGDSSTDEPERGDSIIETDDPYAGSDGCDMSNEHDIAFETANEPPTDSSSVVVARRHVSVAGGFEDGSNAATLVVEVW